jgi:flagellar biosynthetic protein FlhB
MSAEKTEEPTDKKLLDARRRGEVPKSRELGAAFVLLACAGALASFGANVSAGLRALIVRALAEVARPTQEPVALLASCLGEGLALLAPLLLPMMLVGAVVAYVQVGPVFAFGRLVPKLERLDPVQAARRLFGMQGVVELLKALFVLGTLAFVAYRVLVDAIPVVASAAGATPSALHDAVGALVPSLLVRVGFAFLALGVADLFYQRFRHRRELRMTKDEVKREYRESEGDPNAKQARTRMHKELVEHATLEEVRRADVLVVNPTHYAVALCFDREGEQEAPEVVAKGIDHLARRMIDAAREAGVPVVRDVPLAHALYELDLGDEIPEPLYEAVAAVLHTAWEEAEGHARVAPTGTMEGHASVTPTGATKGHASVAPTGEAKGR